MNYGVREVRAWVRAEIQNVMLSALEGFVGQYPKLPGEDVLAAIDAIHDQAHESLKNSLERGRAIGAMDTLIECDPETGEYVTFAEMGFRIRERKSGRGFIRLSAAAAALFGNEDPAEMERGDIDGTRTREQDLPV